VAHTTSRSPATSSLSTYHMEVRENVTYGLPFYKSPIRAGQNF
jgi:hypothetical protein